MFNYKKVLVIGTGISGISATALLRSKGAEVVLFDANETMVAENIKEKVNHDLGVFVYIKEIPIELLEQIELCVVSPGVPLDCEIVSKVKKEKIPIWSEIELAFLFEKGNMIAITGTNGKTTTTTLVGEIMKAYYNEVFVVGNIGNPYAVEVEQSVLGSITVAELSSFQLETIHKFKPHISAVLNVTPDHLDRHKTMDAYARAKFNITQNQGAEDFCILNYEDNYSKQFLKSIKAQVIWFSSKQKVKNGYYLENNYIIYCDGEKEETILDVTKDMNLVGNCNYENVMAGIAMASAMNVPLDIIKKVVKQFQAVEHRIEFVGNKLGVDYFNDSKGTNPDAAIQGIKAMSKKTVLIAGGYDKKSSYDEWILSFEGKVTGLLLIGQTKEKIAQCARKHNMMNIELFDTFEEACIRATDLAKPGDAVLLSPACASWGMFRSYEERGNLFKKYVNRIKEI